MTLNSIDWEEKIFILEDNELKIIEIGKYIDAAIEKKDGVKYMGNNKEEEMGDTVYVDTMNKNIYTISVNKNGKVRWKKVEALTKHLPMNKDGTNDLVKITTRLGRTATATKAKSFLTRINNKIVPIRGDEIKVGTKIPLMVNFPELPCGELTHLDMSKYFSKTKYIFGSEMKKAKKAFDEAYVEGGRRKPWFKHNMGNLFTVPYTRVDSLKKVMCGGVKQVYKDGCIYPKKGKYMVAKIPEMLPLNREWGFFFGSYLAEGLSTGIYTCISNNDKVYMKRITDLCDKYNIGYHIVVQENKNQKGWTSTDLKIHSVVLAKFLKMVFKTGSAEKIIPDWVYQAPREFTNGVLDGYFCGDGSIPKTSRCITCCSISEKMIDGLVILLSKYGIICKKGKPSLIKKNNRGSKNIKQAYTISIRNNNIKKFHQHISLVLDYKQNRLNELSKMKFKCKNGMYDIIPGNNLQKFKGNIHRDKIEELIKNNVCKIRHSHSCEYIHVTKKDKKYLKRILKSNVYHDDIVKIELIKPTHKYVYDMTIEDTKNFVIQSAISVRDTFHHAGLGIGATLGVPRIKEILSLSKNMKTPIMTIYLDKDHRHDKSTVDRIASFIKYTTIEDIRKSVKIYYDPNPKKGGFMEKDNVHNIFHSRSPTKYSCQSTINNLPWLARIELNKEMLLEKNITLLDIKSIFCDQWEKRYINIKQMKKPKKKLLEKITQCAILSNNDNDRTLIIHIRFDMINYNNNTIIDFVDIFVDDFKLKGLKSISYSSVVEKPYIDYDNEDQNIVEKKHNFIYTAGINLEDIRYINGIDINRTICNDVVQVYRKFGIDAARTILLKELINVFKTAGNDINYQHLSLLVDIMTNSGKLMSIDRHGLNNLDKDPLARASFEKPVDQLITAAVFGETDYMKSVSSRIMAGLVVNGGTGLCEIALDTDLLEKSEYVEDAEIKYHKTFSELTTDNIMSDILRRDEIDTFIPI